MFYCSKCRKQIVDKQHYYEVDKQWVEVSSGRQRLYFNLKKCKQCNAILEELKGKSVPDMFMPKTLGYWVDKHAGKLDRQGFQQFNKKLQKQHIREYGHPDQRKEGQK